MKVAMKVLSTTWLPRSRTKPRAAAGRTGRRASCKVTMVIENVRLAMVTIEPATAEGWPGPPPAPRLYVRRRTRFGSSGRWSSQSVRKDSRTDPATIKDGTNQKLERSESQ
ncbi:MAG: hypothetical protein WKF75_02020 [Singulisphaera sp.]